MSESATSFTKSSAPNALSITAPTLPKKSTTLTVSRFPEDTIPTFSRHYVGDITSVPTRWT